MSLRDKAAQMVWPSPLANYTSTDSHEWRVLLHDVQDEHVGGVSISFGSPIEMAAKLNALQRAAPLPLLVGSDLEYGAGQRARGGYFVPNGVDLGGATVFPPEMAVGATRDTTLAYAEGSVTAREGRALGIMIAYAPVLDVNINAANPVINTRSFGESPALDAAFGRAVIHGLQDHGMLATGKHFPGHGDTETNSHLALPIVRVSRARLDTVELVPFRAAIGAGVGAIMSFHGSMPALDSSGVPGTLSPAVLTGLLRGQLGFHGVIISDAMDMRGVLDQFGAVEAAKRAVAAGADVLIQPQDVGQTIDAIVAGVREGRYPESRLDASVRRLLTLKEATGLVRNRIVDLDSVRTVVGDSANAAVAQTIADRSITVVRDSAHLLPLGRLTPGARVLVITIARRPDLGAGGTFATELRRRFPSLRAEYVDADDPVGALTRLRHVADSSTVTIVCSYVTQNWQATTLAVPTSVAAFIQDVTAGGGGAGGGGGERAGHRRRIRQSLLVGAGAERADVRRRMGRIPRVAARGRTRSPWYDCRDGAAADLYPARGALRSRAADPDPQPVVTRAVSRTALRGGAAAGGAGHNERAVPDAPVPRSASHRSPRRGTRPGARGGNSPCGAGARAGSHTPAAARSA
jgi:beta-N-acetylhexosaminidase